MVAVKQWLVYTIVNKNKRPWTSNAMKPLTIDTRTNCRTTNHQRRSSSSQWKSIHNNKYQHNSINNYNNNYNHNSNYNHNRNNSNNNNNNNLWVFLIEKLVKRILKGI